MHTEQIEEIVKEIWALKDTLTEDMAVCLILAKVRGCSEMVAKDTWQAAINNHIYHINQIETDKDSFLKSYFGNSPLDNLINKARSNKLRFSEWVNSHALDLDKAGDGYEALYQTSKMCIDSAIERYIKYLTK